MSVWLFFMNLKKLIEELPEQEREKFIESLFDFEKFIEAGYLKIKLETGDILPFVFNSAQKRVVKKIKTILGIERIDFRLLANRDFVLKIINLKARQQGMSTFFQALIFWWNELKENQKCLTMGHKIDASDNLFQMYNRFYDNLPKILKHALLRSNEKKISYLHNGSENKIATAGSEEIGRSDTLQAYHFTEVAFYQNARQTFLGVSQGAKYAKIQIYESTANGFNEFQAEWDNAVKAISDFHPIFLSWLDFPEYIIEAKKRGFIKELDDEEKFMKDLGNPLFNEYPNEEQILRDKYKATIEQLQWRRYAITNLCKGDINGFHQEYPRDPEEAFISSGQPVFNMARVQERLAVSRKPLRVGDLIPVYDKTDGYKKSIEEGRTSYIDLIPFMIGVEFEENQRGFISIWSEIEKSNTVYRYAAGVDVAEGLEQGDYSTARYYDRMTDEVCLTWHGHLDPDLFGEEIHKIHWFLDKNTYVGVERNNHGPVVIKKLYALNVPQYTAERFDKGYPEDSSKLGWLSNGKTKPHMIGIMVEWIRENLLNDYDKDFWNECRTFVRSPGGKMQADGKEKSFNAQNFDDRVIAGGIMLLVHHWLPAMIKRGEPEVYARKYINEIYGKPSSKTSFGGF